MYTNVVTTLSNDVLNTKYERIYQCINNTLKMKSCIKLYHISIIIHQFPFSYIRSINDKNI